MLPTQCEKLDPRVRRTRHLLHDALKRLLQEKEFEKISVQDLTDAATLNRATFYAHYTDKFALLEEWVRVSFLSFLERRNVSFDGTCPRAFEAVILAVCDYLVEIETSLACKRHQFEPFLQTTMIDQIRLVLLEGFERHPVERRIPVETIAATASWAIYGAAKQWLNTPNRGAPEDFVPVAAELVVPVIMAGAVGTAG